MTGILWLARRAARAALVHGVRPLDRVLPPRVLLALVSPFVAASTALELSYTGPRLAEFTHLRSALGATGRGAGWWLALWRQRSRLNLANLAIYWADRLNRPGWAALRRVEGSPPARGLLETRARPVILATFHFGPGLAGFHGLRASGIPIAVLAVRAPNPVVGRLGAAVDRANDLEGVPHRFAPEDLREAAEFLLARRVLLIFVTGGSGQSVEVEADGMILPLAPGALRLATIVDADVIPCVFSAGRGGLATLLLGDPLPEAEVKDRRWHPAACERLLRFYMPTLRERPGQSDTWLLRGVRPARRAGPRAEEVAASEAPTVTGGTVPKA